MSYVDGFVFPVSKKNRAAYMKMAREGKRMFKKLGAIGYMESRLEDMKGMPGGLTFKKLVKPKAGEEVWFSYVVYKNKKARDAANKKMMQGMENATPAEKKKWGAMPFDMKRMAYGGFQAEVE